MSVNGGSRNRRTGQRVREEEESVRQRLRGEEQRVSNGKGRFSKDAEPADTRLQGRRRPSLVLLKKAECEQQLPLLSRQDSNEGNEYRVKSNEII